MRKKLRMCDNNKTRRGPRSTKLLAGVHRWIMWLMDLVNLFRVGRKIMDHGKTEDRKRLDIKSIDSKAVNHGGTEEEMGQR